MLRAAASAKWGHTPGSMAKASLRCSRKTWTLCAPSSSVMSSPSTGPGPGTRGLSPTMSATLHQGIQPLRLRRPRRPHMPLRRQRLARRSQMASSSGRAIGGPRSGWRSLALQPSWLPSPAASCAAVIHPGAAARSARACMWRRPAAPVARQSGTSLRQVPSPRSTLRRPTTHWKMRRVRRLSLARWFGSRNADASSWDPETS
mmetsp:Transcript_105693/g.340893  ORF Transcript_105693/g.340893 Transcript_105693/m.340893 type:complete len:203 (-) Transcript_105693:1258-1866(-)